MARYKLIGTEIEGQDVNTSTPSHAQQVIDPRGGVVYETDDKAEADAILQAGGFYRNRDTFIAVSRLVDAPNMVSGSGVLSQAVRNPQPFPQKGN